MLVTIGERGTRFIDRSHCQERSNLSSNGRAIRRFCKEDAMNNHAESGSRNPTGRWLKLVGAWLIAIALSAVHAAQAAPDNDATQILKRMTDYLAAQQTISATIDTDIEVITTELQKIQFANSGQLLLSRPNQLRASRVGGYADVELIFDGTTISIFGKHLNQYAQVNAPGSLEELIDRLRAGTGAALPFTELMLSSAYEELTADVIDAKHIGRGVVGGVECEHLAFRTPEVDWQLWVEVGSRPIPRKYVITSKTVAGSPQFTLLVKEFRTDAPVDANTFVFTPPEGASQVALGDLKEIDEVPSGVVPEVGAGGRR
jgi:hypothetical protein